ncbi:hypothetical protein [Mesorhizobium sp. M2E.F.Ca.ET.209.01.1.1]|nr:hypothetical protein [Mesorhizobium sp. M2E.F.Ca.ET.209.01.1.1]
MNLDIVISSAAAPSACPTTGVSRHRVPRADLRNAEHARRAGERVGEPD